MMVTRSRARITSAALSMLMALWIAPADAAPGKRMRATAGSVQKHLGIYLTTGPLRGEAERIRLQQTGIEVWFLRPTSPAAQEAAVCEGARWLMTGRLAQTAGVGALFAERSEIDQVTLVFYDMVTSVKLDRSGRYAQQRTPTPDVRLTISRSKAAQLDPAALAGTLNGRRCASVARSVLDEVWVRER